MFDVRLEETLSRILPGSVYTFIYCIVCYRKGKTKSLRITEKGPKAVEDFSSFGSCELPHRTNKLIM